MKSSVRSCLGLVALSSFAVFTACGDDDATPSADAGSHQGGAKSAGGEPSAHAGESAAHGGQGQAGRDGHADGAIVCEVLGELCHAADEGEGAARDCHEVGHKGNAAACEAEFAGCIAACTDDDGAGGAAGTGVDARCAALGELCHVADTGEGTAHDCHQIGHDGNAAACAEAFDDCAVFCLEAREELEAGEGGAGGAAAGGAPGGAGGAK